MATDTHIHNTVQVKIAYGAIDNNAGAVGVAAAVVGTHL